MKLIASEKLMFESPDPAGVYCYTPAVCEGFEKRLVAAVDLGGPGTGQLEGPRSAGGDYPSGNQVRIFLSDDAGECWREAADRLPMRHEILFRAGKRIYALGNDVRLVVSASDDNGEHWTSSSVLEADGTWHQGSATVSYRGGRIYLVYEKYLAREKVWPHIVQYFLSAPVDADLLKRESWTISEPFNGDSICAQFRAVSDLPDSSPAGILETHVLPAPEAFGHLADPGRNTFLLVARFNSWGLPVAAFLRGVEHPDGTLGVELLPGRSTGLPFFTVPFPGGSLKFSVIFDSVSNLYFLAANDTRDVFSSWGAEPLSNRRKLSLWCAPDCCSWQYAGCIAFGPCERGARSYPQMIVFGNDLLVFARSGDGRAKSHHDNNQMTFHRVPDFRKLAADVMQ